MHWCPCNMMAYIPHSVLAHWQQPHIMYIRMHMRIDATMQDGMLVWVGDPFILCCFARISVHVDNTFGLRQRVRGGAPEWGIHIQHQVVDRTFPVRCEGEFRCRIGAIMHGGDTEWWVHFPSSA